MKVTADGVQGNESVDRQVSRQVEAQLGIEEDGGEDIKVRRVGALVDECRRWENEIGAFAFAANSGSFLDTVWRHVVGWWDCRRRATEGGGTGTKPARGCESRMKREVGDARVVDICYGIR